MKANESTVLIGSKVVLVPYLPEHVPKYHTWMQDEELRQLTASEPLTLQEEYEMQQKWRHDDDKLTFIILSRTASSGEQLLPDVPQVPSPTNSMIQALPMVGDVNMFLNGVIPIGSEAPFEGHAQDGEDTEHFEAEMEIMIAEAAFRRKGFALEALQLMLEYATGYPNSYFSNNSQPCSTSSLIQFKGLGIPPSSLVARISEANEPSIRLFELLGFCITRRVKVFKEVELRFKYSSESISTQA